MNVLRICLFRRLSVERGGQVVEGLNTQKVRELLCYLLINQHRPHTRDLLADLLWPESSGLQAKQYLRQTLWQLQSILQPEQACNSPFIIVEANWLGVNQASDVVVDIREFEKLYNLIRGREGHTLSAAEVEQTERGIQLYQGDLLENWYQDWCILERERLQNIYLTMLDKLLGYCESVCAYESGLMYATKILRCDRAHERTYRRLMRLYYQAGDRTSALRQFDRCSAILLDELGVRPSRQTVALYEQIHADRLELVNAPAFTTSRSVQSQTTTESTQGDITIRLMRLRETLLSAQHQVEQEIAATNGANIPDS